MPAVPLVSVILPVHNGEATLRQALESLLRQTLEDFEIVGIDDGSTDGTGAILAEFARADRRVRPVRQEKRGEGLNQALIRGCAAAGGRYLARMDADDISFPDRLEKQVRFLQAHPAIAVLGAAMQCMDGRGPLPHVPRQPAGVREIRATLPRHNCISHPTVMMRREIYDAIGGYRRAFRHAEDYDLWLRIAERHDLCNLEEPVLFYRLHPGQLTFARIPQQALYTLAARTAARRRREGGADPAEGREAITRADLVEMGVSEEAIDRGILEAYIDRGNFLAGLGLLDQASSLAEELERLPLGVSAHRRMLADLSWLRGKIDLAKRRWMRSLVWTACACLRRPS